MPIYSHLSLDSTNYLENVYLERDRLRMGIGGVAIAPRQIGPCAAGSEERAWLARRCWAVTVHLLAF